VLGPQLQRVFHEAQAAAVYNKVHPEVTISIVDIPENIEGKIQAGLQAVGAGLPDIALFQDFSIESYIQNYPGIFVDLKAAGVDYSKFAQYGAGIMTEGNKVYGIPFDTGSTGFWLRADMIKATGLNPDNYLKARNWTQMTQLGVTVKAKTDKALISYDNTSFDFLRIMVQSTGTQFFKPDGSLNFRTPAMMKSLTILKDLNTKGLLYGTEGWNNWIAAINGGSRWYVFASSPNEAAAVDFQKTAWASSAPDALAFYNTILKGAGAMGTYLPSRTGSNYTAKDEFFYKSQTVFKDFATWMEKVPVLKYTANYSPMRDSLRNAILLMFKGDLKTVDDASPMPNRSTSRPQEADSTMLSASAPSCGGGSFFYRFQGRCLT
jgi:lactose/L-arabinose transport system substrate-binding protein